MKTLWKYAQKYKEEMTIADFALLKVCLFSAGLLAGMAVPKKNKTKAAAWAGTAFLFSYAPLITKFLGIVMKESNKKLDS